MESRFEVKPTSWPLLEYTRAFRRVENGLWAEIETKSLIKILISYGFPPKSTAMAQNGLIRMLTAG